MDIYLEANPPRFIFLVLGFFFGINPPIAVEISLPKPVSELKSSGLVAKPPSSEPPKDVLPAPVDDPIPCAPPKSPLGSKLDKSIPDVTS